MWHIYLSLHAAKKPQGLRKVLIDTEESDSSCGGFDFEGWDNPVNDMESFKLPGKM